MNHFAVNYLRDFRELAIKSAGNNEPWINRQLIANWILSFSSHRNFHRGSFLGFEASLFGENQFVTRDAY